MALGIKDLVMMRKLEVAGQQKDKIPNSQFIKENMCGLYVALSMVSFRLSMTSIQGKCREFHSFWFTQSFH